VTTMTTMERTSEPSESLADGDWLSSREAARRLGLTPRTLYRLIDIGDLPAYRFGRVIRLKGYDLDAFVERSRIAQGQLKHLHDLETVAGTASQ